jgi:fatty acid desaturase
MTVETPSPRLNDPEFLRRVNALRDLDNRTNWYYVAREYLYSLAVVAATIAFSECRQGWGLSWAWNIPVTVVAIVMVGAGQHRLTTLGHEASHYMLFGNRLLNELASDWLCMFPVLSTTHYYRLQHLAHHQFVNDPDLDPDIVQMTASGHRFRFPMPGPRFLWECIGKQLLWLPGLVRYMIVRARYAAAGGGTGPYGAKRKRSPLLMAVGVVYLLTIAITTDRLAAHGRTTLLAILPPALYLAALTFYCLAPDRYFASSLLRPDVKPRWTVLMRVTYLTILFTTLAWLCVLTGIPFFLYYLLLWIVPIATTFSFFMIMRQVVQHGNATRERFTNTRIFLVEPLIRFAVFPLGMDYHLPHHLFPMIPHYRLKQLHALLNESEAYRREATVVDGYFRPRDPEAGHLTVLDLMARPIG